MRLKGNKLIMVSGIDGSGKSSHLAWIAAALEAEAQSYSYVRLRFSALTSYPLLGLARLMGYAPRRYNPRSGTVVIEHRYHKNPLMRTIWPRLFVLDTVISAWRKVLRPLQRGEWVLCDRYVLDAMVDVATMLHNDRLLSGWFASRLGALVPQGARSLILDTDPMTAYNRKLDILEPGYVVKRRPLYMRVAQSFGVPVVDGNRSFGEVQSDIARVLGITPLPEHLGVLPEGIA